MTVHCTSAALAFVYEPGRQSWQIDWPGLLANLPG
jgi:hypothetical protein